MVLVVIDYETCKVEVAGIIPQAYGGWMKQIARNLTDPFGGFLKDKKYLIHDCDPLFTRDSREILKVGGIDCKKTTVACPNMTLYETDRRPMLNRNMTFFGIFTASLWLVVGINLV